MSAPDKFTQPVGIHVDPGPAPALAKAARDLLECLGRHAVNGRSVHFVHVGRFGDYNEALDALRAAVEGAGR